MALELGSNSSKYYLPGIVTFPGNCRATYGMLDLSFFVVRENPAEHWLGDEIQTCNL